MNRFVLSRRAARDIHAIGSYVDRHSGPLAADRVTEALHAGISEVAEHPGFGHCRADVMNPNYLFWPVFSYVIAYRVERGSIKSCVSSMEQEIWVGSSGEKMAMTQGRTLAKTISQTFEKLRSDRQIALMPFVPAGYPDLETTAAVLPALEAGGASLIEIGIPFSDPVADGPTIQAAFTEALAKKLKVADVFRTIAQVRPKVSIPLVAMVSYSVVFRYGLDRFLRDAKSSGFDGLILPDLPPPEAQRVCSTVRAAGLETILLVAPSTTPARRKEIAQLSSGFVYYLSVAGITGERDQFPADLAAKVAELKQLTDRPVCVGFGIHRPQQVADLAKVADGAIVGSAIVKRMKQHASGGPTAIADALSGYCRELLSLVRPSAS